MGKPARIKGRLSSKALNASQDLLNLILENSDDTICITDPEGIFIYRSPSNAKVTGYGPDELLGKPLLELVHPDDRERVKAAYDAAWRTRSPGCIEYRYRHRDGHYIWFETKGFLLFDEKGNPTGAIFFGRDITKRKRAEEALRESEERFRSIFNNASVGVLLVDQAGNILNANEACCRLLGYTQEEITGMPLSRFDIPADQELENSLNQELYQGKRESYLLKKQYLRKDGEKVWLRSNTSLVRDSNGNPRYRIIICEDITPLKVKERELAAQEQLYTTMLGALEEASLRSGDLNTLADLAVSLQATGYEGMVAERLLQAAAELTGVKGGVYYAYDVTSRSLNLVGVVGLTEREKARLRELPPFPLGTERGLVGVVALTRRPVYIPDVAADPRLVKANPGICSCYKVPIYYRKRLYGVLVLISDRVNGFSREQRTLAHTLASYMAAAMENARLFAEAQRAYESLNLAQRQLSHAQKMEAIGQLAGGMAHELNNQLTIIHSYVDLYINKVKNASLANALQKIRKAAWHSANLTRQLMLFGRKQPQFMTLININQNVQELEPVLTRLLGKGITLKLSLSRDLLPVYADATNIDQVIINLVLNARDAMPEGGTITIKTDNATFEDGCRSHPIRSGNFACLEVSDTGTGIDEHDLPHIFEPFFTTKEPGKGTGLGLAVAYGIVKAHNGWINVESHLGQGSTFQVFLPAHSPQAATLPPSGRLQV